MADHPFTPPFASTQGASDGDRDPDAIVDGSSGGSSETRAAAVGADAVGADAVGDRPQEISTEAAPEASVAQQRHGGATAGQRRRPRIRVPGDPEKTAFRELSDARIAAMVEQSIDAIEEALRLVEEMVAVLRANGSEGDAGRFNNERVIEGALAKAATAYCLARRGRDEQARRKDEVTRRRLGVLMQRLGSALPPDVGRSLVAADEDGINEADLLEKLVGLVLARGDGAGGDRPSAVDVRR